MKQQILTSVMCNAHIIKAQTGESMSGSLRKAWALFNMKRRMKTTVVVFEYLKTTGEVRRAFGTLLEHLIPESKGTRSIRKSNEVQKYFDVEAGAWRSFKKGSFIKVLI